MLGGAAGRTVCSAGLSFFSAFLLEKPVSIRGHAVGVVFFFPKPLLYPSTELGLVVACLSLWLDYHLGWLART